MANFGTDYTITDGVMFGSDSLIARNSTANIIESQFIGSTNSGDMASPNGAILFITKFPITKTSAIDTISVFDDSSVFCYLNQIIGGFQRELLLFSSFVDIPTSETINGFIPVTSRTSDIKNGSDNVFDFIRKIGLCDLYNFILPVEIKTFMPNELYTRVTTINPVSGLPSLTQAGHITDFKSEKTFKMSAELLKDSFLYAASYIDLSCGARTYYYKVLQNNTVQPDANALYATYFSRFVISLSKEIDIEV